MKKVLLLFTILSVLMICITSCKGQPPSEGLAFTSNGDGTCYVSGIGTCAAEKISIPDRSPDGDIVIAIGNEAFRNCGRLTSVTIPDGVKSIGQCAFYSCGSLTKVTLPDGLENIGPLAFSDCGNLTSITIPDSVKGIGNYAFEDCDRLTAIYITDLEAFCKISRGEGEYSYNLYLKKQLVTDLEIPDSIKNINSYAFSGCVSLTSVTIPDSVKMIGTEAFWGCDSLKSVNIPDSVTKIGASAFACCTDLEDVYYTGSKEDWQDITIGSDNNDLTSATIHYNYVP